MDQGIALSREFGCGSPLLDEFREQYGTSEILGHETHGRDP